ncbi:hypothetical protein SAMN04489802_0001, partial [Pseudomonas chlororaphis]
PGLGEQSAGLETQIGVTNLVMEPNKLYTPAIASRIALNALLAEKTRP